MEVRNCGLGNSSDKDLSQIAKYRYSPPPSGLFLEKKCESLSSEQHQVVALPRVLRQLVPSA